MSPVIVNQKIYISFSCLENVRRRAALEASQQLQLFLSQQRYFQSWMEDQLRLISRCGGRRIILREMFQLLSCPFRDNAPFPPFSLFFFA